MVVSILVSAFFAYIGNQLKTDIGLIAQATSIFFGICAAAFLPAYVGALYLKKLSRKAAITSILTGTIASFIWIFFIHAKNAATIGLCQLVFGKPHLLAETSLVKLAQVDAVIIAVPLSILALIIGAALTRPDVNEQHIAKCFDGV